MRPRFLEACQSFQSAEKACWEILLRELPDGDSFSLETLSDAMDHTLEQLWAILATDSIKERLRELSTNPSPLPTRQECGLASYLPYFNAGERALELIAAEVERTYPDLSSPECNRERDELCSAFSVLVQCQLQAICSRCPLGGQCRYSDFKAVAELPRTPMETEPAPAEDVHPRVRRARAKKVGSRRRPVG
jgi:hypothetical protein